MRIERKGAVLAALVLTLCLCLMTGCGRKDQDGVVNVFDYVDVTYDGSNGSGKAAVNIDYDGLETEMVGGKDKVEDLELDELTKYINCVASLSFHADPLDGLSNGDTVKVTVSYDKDAAGAAGVTFDTESEREYKVSGLK